MRYEKILGISFLRLQQLLHMDKNPLTIYLTDMPEKMVLQLLQ